MFYPQKTVTEKQNTTADYAAEISKLCEEISFNPNVFTDFKLGGTQEVRYVAYRCFV